MSTIFSALLAILLIALVMPVRAQVAKGDHYQELQDSTSQLQKDWENVRKEYIGKFKAQLDPINRQIDELKDALDYGDVSKRKEINGHLNGLKKSRDNVRQAIHELTATSIVKASGAQKHFKNAKDDTKD